MTQISGDFTKIRLSSQSRLCARWHEIIQKSISFGREHFVVHDKNRELLAEVAGLGTKVVDHIAREV